MEFRVPIRGVTNPMENFVTFVAGIAALIALIRPTPPQAQDCSPATFPGAWKGEVALCQNWDQARREEFWFLSQGSLLVPYDWFLELERKDSTGLFRDGDHMDRFRYLPQNPTPQRNPDGLPIGFTKDDPGRMKPFSDIDKRWLGMTCAACHTNQIEFGEHKILVDGAPAMADFQSFMEALEEAMRVTLNDAAKFDRFATAVLARQQETATAGRKSVLKKWLKKMADLRRDWNGRNKGEHPYGFARLDAIGAILNEVSIAADSAAGTRGRYPPANAPVSYPDLWDTSHYDRVQWNGSVSNKGLGAIGRNVGEVLGVFGGLEYQRVLGNRSSVDIEHLGQLEQLVSTLAPPKWPETLLPAIDRSPTVQNKGKAAFEKFCVSCHKHIEPGMKPPFKAFMITAKKAGTDPTMARNFANRSTATGILEGRPTSYLRVLSKGEEFKKVDFDRSKLSYAVIGSLFRRLIFDLPTTLKAIKAGKADHTAEPINDVENRLKRNQDRLGRPTADGAEQFLKAITNKSDSNCDVPDACYKARSLRGIWSTAPYLHNGSVRTMRQLLLPVSQREKKFRVGSRKYDPVDLGFVSEGGYELDTTLPGNSNSGHEYGANALANDPDLVSALLEYIKTL